MPTASNEEPLGPPRVHPRAFALLASLAEHNAQAWFATHREAFLAEVRRPFGAILTRASEALQRTLFPVQGGPATVFMHSRDLLGGEDTRPYTEFVAGVLTPSGHLVGRGAVVYIQLNADGGHVSAGFYRPTPSEIDAIRRRMVAEPEFFRAALYDLAQADLTLSAETTLTTLPSTFAHLRGHEFEHYLRLPSLSVVQPIPKETWVRGEAAAYIVAHVRMCEKLLRFGHGAIATPVT
ncbi:MAG: DUF2461 family protein [Bacteroidota bacterium]